MATLPAGLELTDAQLVKEYVSGHDHEAFATLVRRYGPLVRSVCRHVLAVPFLRDHLRPVPEPDWTRIRQHISDLGSGRLAAREKAQRALEVLGSASASRQTAA